MVLLALAGLLGGLALLAVASGHAVRAAVGLSEALRLRRFAVGFLFIALTTTLPEALVSVSASLQGAPGLAAGNVLGSAMANLTVVLGVAVLAAGALVVRGEAVEDLVEVLFVTALVALLVLSRRALGPLEAAVLLGLFSLFVVKARVRELGPRGARRGGLARPLAGFLAAVALLVLGSEAAVRSSLALVAPLGASPELLGLTVVAMGTSLPELAVAIRSIRAREYGLALGDLLGASIVNLTLVLGMVAAIQPAPLDLAEIGAVPAFLLLAALGWWFLLSKGWPVGRGLAALFIALYAAFLLERLGLLAPLA